MPALVIITVSFTSHPDTDPPLYDSPALQQCIEGLRREPECEALHYGFQVEDSSILHILACWKPHSSNVEVEACAGYKSLTETLPGLYGNVREIRLVELEDSAQYVETVMSAPVLEYTTFYHDGDPAPAYASSARSVDPELRQHIAGYLGMVFGITHGRVESKGVLGRAAVVLVGWHSIESHVAFLSSPMFKEKSGLLRGDSKAIDFCHVVLK